MDFPCEINGNFPFVSDRLNVPMNWHNTQCTLLSFLQYQEESPKKIIYGLMVKVEGYNTHRLHQAGCLWVANLEVLVLVEKLLDAPSSFRLTPD